MITAILRNNRIAPRKARLVADMIRGKSTSQAKVILANAIKKARHPIADLLDSAIANAKHNFNIEGNLYVKEICVDPGIVMKRFMPVSRGSAHGIKKRTSHIRLVLAPLGERKLLKAGKAPKTEIAAKAKEAKPVKSASKTAKSKK